jgi:integrase
MARRLTYGRSSAGSRSQNQAFSALLLLYQEVLARELTGLDDAVRAKRPVRVPLVPTPGEVAAILGRLRGGPWLMASLMYGAGLRLLEYARLRIKDIDFARSQITIRDGKGRKDRVTVLPSVLAGPLQEHLERVRRQPRSARAVNDSKLVPVIRASYAQSRATYGRPRVHKDLQALSHRISRKRVARLMRREGLSARPPRRYRRRRSRDTPLPVAPTWSPKNSMPRHRIDCIAAFYNPHRRHWSIGYLSPMDYEKQHAAAVAP